MVEGRGLVTLTGVIITPGNYRGQCSARLADCPEGLP
jgi:hypothetical protein